MAKVVFFGTPEYVIPVLQVLRQKHEVLAVVTQPPKPVGRKQALTPSPVAGWAQAGKIRVLTDLENLPSADVGILAAYGKLVPGEIIEHFPHGIINIHPSLLPKYRGASPVQAAIASGEKETGVTIIKLDEEMDHGPILAQFAEEIKSEDTTGSLRDRLFGKSAEVLLTILPGYLKGHVTPCKQDHGRATYTKIVKKEHGFIPGKFLEAALRGETINEPLPVPFVKNSSFVLDSSFLERFIRALSPWPGAWTQVPLTSYQVKRSLSTIGKLARLKILKAHVEPFPLIPNAQSLVPDLVQLEGKNPVSWQQFKEGYPQAQLQ